MMAKVLVALVPFLSFAFTYSVSKVHNMLVLMLDLHFKCLNVVKTFLRRAKVIQIVAKYDIMTLMPLLVATFQFQNLNIVGPIKPLVVDDESIFGAMISNEIPLHGFFENELSLFQNLHVKRQDCLLPLIYKSPMKYDFLTSFVLQDKFSKQL
jgi:hypothetical protein